MSTHPKVVLIGSVHEAQPALDALLDSDLVDVAAVVTHTRAHGRNLSGAVNLATRARPLGVPVIRTDNANSRPVVDAVRALEPDLLVVVGWNRLIRADLLGVASHGCIGFHASLLPYNRGHAPVNWAILRGETTTGNTMMFLDAGVDTGDIIAQTPIPIAPEDTCGTVYARVAQSGAHMLMEHLPAILDGTVQRQRQPWGDAEVLPRRTPEMGVIDWTWPRQTVHNWVRALTTPYPGAYTSVGGKRAMVWATERPRPSPHPRRKAAPGTICSVEADGLRIAVGDGDVLVTRMSEPGQQPMHARRWLRRARVDAAAFDAVPAEVAAWARGEHGPSAVAG